MSAGPFSASIYQSASGRLYNCRVQPETIALTLGADANSPVAGPADQAVSARASSSTRSFGCTMRSVTLRWVGTPPAGYSGDDVRVPVLTEALFNATALQSLGLYQDIIVRVVGKNAEKER